MKNGFEDRHDTDSRTHNKATFVSLLISEAICKIGSETYPVDGVECNYDRDNYNQPYLEIENVH